MGKVGPAGLAGLRVSLLTGHSDAVTYVLLTVKLRFIEQSTDINPSDRYSVFGFDCCSCYHTS